MTKYKLSREDQEEIDFMDIQKSSAGLSNLKITLKCKTEGQGKLRDSIKSKEITICSGLAGTGKTYIACAQALKLLKSYPNKYKKIVLVKSVTTLKDEEIGFLKGGLEDKMEPFIYSFIHNFEKIIGKAKVSILKNSDIITVMPIAYMRGINLDNSVVIIDEAQNISIENIRTILTRLGSNSKMIFLGDQKQSDNKKNGKNALDFMIDNFTDIEEMGLVRLGMDDVVRNPLIKKIEAKFEQVL
jgi:phosphate starvation-inducible protein PhoH and related proteins